MKLAVEKNVMVPTRDGTRLATDIYRPAGDESFPTLVVRLPYGKDRFLTLPMYDVFAYVQAGYAVIIQDCRGTFRSEGDFYPIADDSDDGVDTIAWATGQPWSSGEIGMFGPSYMGWTQWLAASDKPEGLRALATSITSSEFRTPWYGEGGAFGLATALFWTLLVASGEAKRRIGDGRGSMQDFGSLFAAMDNFDALCERMPLRDVPEFASVAPYYEQWLAHPDDDDFWRTFNGASKIEQVEVPVLHIAGWYDIFQAGTLASYRAMRERGGSTTARHHQRLIIGPWGHVNQTGVWNDRSYGLHSNVLAADMPGETLRWLDHWVKGVDNGFEDSKRVKLFVMGVDEWREEDDWPLPDTQFRDYYLHSGGRANTASGDGTLTLEVPDEDRADAYLFDPRHPVPTVGGALLTLDLANRDAGPWDQRAVESRDDVLCYTTPVLEEAIEVTGPVELVLYAESSAKDTDFTGKLVDVHPDGKAEILTHGILRARYRESLEAPTLLQPGEVYELRLDLWATSNVFRPGHRIRLEVSSSDFPRFDRNTNTGGDIAAEALTDAVVAVNRIHHGASHPSRLILPIIERN
jgi:putative CocE/NonD family hydrolase